MRLRPLLLILSLPLMPFGARAEQAVGPFSAVMTSPAAPNRRALIVTPSFSGGSVNARAALARSDAFAYRDLLRLLGFSGTIVAADTRPALRAAVQNFADTMSRDAEVAVFVLGSIVPAGSKLYVPASGLSASDRAPDHIATAGLDLAEIVGGIAEHGAKEVVAIVDECGGGETKPGCDVGPNTLPDGVSGIVVHRVPGRDGEPVAGVASVRQDLLPLMREPGLNFLQLYSRLKSRLSGTNDGLAATPALSRNFVFLPGDFLAKLPVECNRVDPSAGAETLRRAPSLAPAIAACERAVATYDFSPLFKEKLMAAREQLAFQKAVAGCGGGAAAYLDAYSNGAFRFAVNEHASECERERQPAPQPVSPAPAQEAPVAEATTPSLQSLARIAVNVYYDRHSYTAGDNLGGVAALYPPVFAKRDGNVTRDGQITELRTYYSKLASISFQILAESLDFSGCETPGSCLVRGTTRASYRKLGDFGEKTSFSTFSLRFDLRRGLKVLYECSLLQQRKSREAPCE